MIALLLINLMLDSGLWLELFTQEGWLSVWEIWEPERVGGQIYTYYLKQINFNHL